MKYLGISMDCDLSFQLQSKTTLRNMATSIRTLHQITKGPPSAIRLVFRKNFCIKSVGTSHLFVYGLIQNTDQFPGQAKKLYYHNCLFRKKLEGSFDMKIKRQIVSFESYSKNSCLKYLIRLLKGLTASFNNFFSKCGTKTQHKNT